MKCLHIDDKYLTRHNEFYKRSLMIALGELADGRELKFRDQRSKRCIKFLSTKKAVHVDGCGICYVRLVQTLLEKYDILVAKPCVLQRCVSMLDEFERILQAKFPKQGNTASKQMRECEEAKKVIKELFSYENFGAGKCLYAAGKGSAIGNYFTWKPMENWGAWHFLQALDVRTCAYCNGDGVFSLLLNSKLPGSAEMVVDMGDTRRSPFDHFFGHSDYPCLGLSLFNLVPSCTRCNTNMKGAKKQDIKTHVHPYLESFDDGERFYALFDRYAAIAFPKERDVHVILRPPVAVQTDCGLQKRAAASSQFFHLEEVYNQTYGQELVDIVRRVIAIPQAYRDDLKKRFPGIDISIANRMLFGCSIDRLRINKERLSKLTCDLWDQLHIDILPTSS